MRKLPHTAAEDLLEIVMRRYERASTLLTSNRPVEDWGKLLGDTAAVTALLDRLLHHAHVLTCGPRSWRTRLQSERTPHEPVPARSAYDASRVGPRSPDPRRAISGYPLAATLTRGDNTLARSRSTAVEHSCLGPLPHWPVLPRPRLAGFQVSTEDHDADLGDRDPPILVITMDRSD